MVDIKFFEEFDDQENTPLTSKKSTTPILDKLGIDLTKLASEGKVDPVIGREHEIEQLVWILARKNKNNPVIIGEPGTGKSHIVGGVALMIAKNECPEVLENKRIISLDVASLTAGAGGAGELQTRVKAILKELAENTDVILFIDEIHMLLAAKSGEMGVADMFKPALARGEMRCIGATTLKEYKLIEKDGALDRRFQKVIMTELSIADTIKILNGIKANYEDFHNVEYTDEAIEACVKLSDRYVTDRYFPDKAIDLMDEVGAKIRINNSVKNPEVKAMEKELLDLKNKFEKLMDDGDFDGAGNLKDRIKEIEGKLKNEVVETVRIKITKSDVEKIISLKTGIPIDRLDKSKNDKILGMAKELKAVVIGQDEAIDKIAKNVIRTNAGLKDPNRPNGVFLMVGASGGGKSYTVKQLAKQLYGSENNMIRIDMSEYGAPHNVARMIGSPPGYVGHGEGGQLTEKVKRKPNSVILFDEIEKAHPDVLDIMLQIFEDGKLTDGDGVTVDFRNTYIFMTSNIGSNQIKNVVEKPAFGFNEVKPEQKVTQIKDDVTEELSRRLKPEFINRIDEIIIFATLTKENIYQLVDIEVDKLRKRVEELGFTLNITDSVKELLSIKGYDPQMGARPLRRAVQTYLENPISMEIMKKNITDKIEVDYDEKSDKIIINGEMINENKFYIKKFDVFNLFS